MLPATLPEAELKRRLAEADAAVVMKVGRHLPKLRRALEASGRLPRAIYVERGTMAEEKMIRSPPSPTTTRPISPSCWCRAGRSGQEWIHDRPLAVVGFGPGDPRYLTPEAEAALADAEALYGYGAYLDRVPVRAGQIRHPSDNREEGARAAAALRHAAQGARVAVVSGGDPGVFAMAAAICEQIEARSGKLARPSRSFHSRYHRDACRRGAIGAPLGHDFCAMSLSDNLKPWDWSSGGSSSGERGLPSSRLNPVSRARPWQFGQAIEQLRGHLPATTPVVFGRAVGRPDERVERRGARGGRADSADMATLVIVGPVRRASSRGPGVRRSFIRRAPRRR